MSERPVNILLEDILEACTRIEDYIRGIGYDHFITNSMIKDAVERNIEIIGEACNMLPADYLQKHTEIEWHKPIGMRNRLIHGYFAVDIPLLWNTITVIIPEFRLQIITLIADYE